MGSAVRSDVPPVPTSAPADDAPVVAIFVPVFNGERYLPATLESLLLQTFTQLEIIVCDDGSTDRSAELADDFARRDRRVRVLRLPHRGEISTRNAGLASISPSVRYVQNHDADDISLPTKIEALVAHLERHPELGIVGCHARYFDDAGMDRGAPPIAEHPDHIRATFGQVNSLIHSAALVRRSVIDDVGVYRDEYRSVEDYDLFARALMLGFRAANLSSTLHLIRLHPGSVSAIRAETQARLALQVQASYRRWLTSGGLPARLAPSLGAAPGSGPGR